MPRRLGQTLFRCGVAATLLLAVIPEILKSQPSVVVTSAAGYESAVAPDSLASLFGANLAGRTVSAQLDANGNLPVELDGISVEINDRAAGLIFVSPGQRISIALLPLCFRRMPPGTAPAPSSTPSLTNWNHSP